LKKFQPKSEYEFENKEDTSGNGIFTIEHNLTKTRFLFIFPDNKWTKLRDVQFYNSKTKGWSGEFWESKISDSEIKRLDEFLKPAIEIGWSSEDFYLFGKHFQSNVYFNKRFNGKKFRYYTGFGCMWILIFPFLWISTLLMKSKIIVGMKKVTIEPTKTFTNIV